MKSFEQFVRENASRYPGLLHKLKAEKQVRRKQRREQNRRALWSHGVRNLGPPI